MRHIAFVILLAFGLLYANAQNEVEDSLSQSRELEEVVIKATRPLSKIDTDGIITTVVGTPLQSLSTAVDVLGYIPGVISSNGNIEVVGKGQPLVYVNGRKLINISELSQIPASKVKDVKVITNPGAKYYGNVNSIIRISTVKEVGDGFSLDSKTTAGIKNYFYATEQLNLNYRTGGLDIFAYGEYAHDKSRGEGSFLQNYYGKSPLVSDLNMNTVKYSNAFTGKLGLNYLTDSGHSFGIFYQNISIPSTSQTTSNSLFGSNNEMLNQVLVKNNKKEKNYDHLVDGYYSGKWGKWSADLTFDFLWKTANEKQHIRETVIDMDLHDMNLNDKSRGRMLAGKLNLNRPLFAGSIDFGGEYTNSNRKDFFISDANSIESSDNQSKESNIGVYVQLNQRLGRFMIQAGVRYEHINSSYYEYDRKITEQSRTTNEFLPSVNIAVPVKNTVFQVGYSRKYLRPLYSQLSSTVHYINQNYYETGNPNLKNTFSDNVTLNFRYKWLTIMATYTNIKNRIITTCTEYKDNPEITLYQKNNSPKRINNLEVIASVMPGFIGKFYYPVLMAGVVAQFYEIEYRNHSMRMNNPMALVRFNNIFRLPHNYMIYANFNYRSDFDSENIHMNGSWQIDISAVKAFDKHWDLRVSINDIFNSARKSGFKLYDGMRDVRTIRYNTVRGVELTVGYKFNTAQSKYKGKGAGQDEIERL